MSQFREQYKDESITKWDIFYYVYGLLHHPEYRERYADNLKRELPRIPFVPLKSPPRSGGDLGGDVLPSNAPPSQSPPVSQGEKPVMTRTTAELWEKLKPFARLMRKEPTPAEEKLWQRLRKKQVAGLRFRRQHPIGNFIADFYCHSARLVIEIDGSIHDLPEQKEYDALRQEYIESLGLRVLRFENGDVIKNIDAVIERIGEEIPTSSQKEGKTFPPPNPLPASQKEGKTSPPPNPLPASQRGGTSALFWQFSEAGKKLADIHLNYETCDGYDVEWVENKELNVDYRVEKMRPVKKRDTENGNYKVYNSLKYNEFLTITGIPEKAFAYRLGNRSALDWIVDQYRVKTDKRSGIVSDPNGYSDDPQYILHLIGRVIQVSVDTVDIVEALAKLDFRE